jgi:nitrogen fixation NifU-like protein
VSDLEDLYQDVLLDHSRRPRNFGRPEGANHTATGNNPLCGDVVTLYVNLEDGRIKAVGFEGQGCAISTASASLLTEAVEGKTVEEAEALFEAMTQMLTGDEDVSEEDLGKLVVFGGVCEYPVRVKCATLAWHTLKAALASEPGSAVTSE